MGQCFLSWGVCPHLAHRPLWHRLLPAPRGSRLSLAPTGGLGQARWVGTSTMSWDEHIMLLLHTVGGENPVLGAVSALLPSVQSGKMQ